MCVLICVHQPFGLSFTQLSCPNDVAPVPAVLLLRGGPAVRGEAGGPVVDGDQDVVLLDGRRGEGQGGGQHSILLVVFWAAYRNVYRFGREC